MPFSQIKKKIFSIIKHSNIALPLLSILCGLPLLIFLGTSDFFIHWPLWKTMKFNAALLLLLIGLRQITFYKRHISLSKIFSWLAVIISGLCFMQFFVDYDLGINHLFQLVHSQKFNQEGPLAPVTSFTFLAISCSLLLLCQISQNIYLNFCTIILAIWGANIASIKILSQSITLFDYVDPGSLTQMSLTTAMGMFFTTMNIILISWNKFEKSQNIFIKRPIIITSMMLFASIFIWQLLLGIQKANIEQLLNAESERLKTQTLNELKFTEEALYRFIHRLEYLGVKDRKFIETDSIAYLSTFPYLSEICFVGVDYKVIHCEHKLNNWKITKSHFDEEIDLSPILGKFKNSKSTISLDAIELISKEKAILITMPIFKNGQIIGYIYSVFQVKNVFIDLIESRMLSFEIKLNSQSIFKNKFSDQLDNFSRPYQFKVSNIVFEYLIVPTKHFVELHSSSIPYFSLFGSLLVTVVVAYFSILTAKIRHNEKKYFLDLENTLEKLKSSERLKSLYKMAIDQTAIVAFTDLQGKITYANKMFTDISEYSEEELFGQDHRLLNSGKMGQEFFKEMWNTILRGDLWHGEICNKSKTGKIYWVDTTIIPILDHTGEIEQFVAIRHDITVQKELQTKLTASNSFKNAILSSANYAIISTGLDGTIASFNKRAEEIFSITAYEVIGKKDPTIFHLKDEIFQRAEYLTHELGIEVIPGFHTLVAKALNTKMADENNWTCINNLGKQFPIRLSATVLTDERDEIIGYLLVAEDRTEQKQNELALIEGKNRLKTLLDLASDGIHILDENGHIVEFSQSFARMLGYTPEETAKLNVTDWDFQIPKEQLIPILKSLLDGGATFETKHLRKDGQVIDVEINAKGIEFGGHKMLYASSRDITERKAQELALNQSERRLKYALEGSNDGVWDWDLEKNELYLSKKLSELFGTAQVLNLNEFDFFKHLYHPDDYEKSIKCIQDHLKGNSAILENEWRLKTRDSKFVWILTRGKISETDASGRPTRFTGVHINIQDFKDSQEKLRQAEEKALLASKAKSDFLSMMSHEIRTPLNGVIGMTDLLLETPLSHEQNDIVQTISHSGKTLITIVNDILDFSKIEAGKMNLEIIEFNFREYLLELLKPFTFTAEKKGIQFNIHIEEMKNKIFGDAGRIGQVINNLVSNAIKFTKTGHVDVSASNKIIGDLCSLTIQVRDTGIGIPLHAKERMFQAFTQAEQSTSRNFGGTGLGLSISKRLVEMMGGSISFESRQGEGTTFSVECQFKNGSPISSSEFAKNILFEDHNFNGRVLVAEDNQTNQIIIGRILSKFGVQYHLVANGNEVLDTLRDSHFDLILMDCQMPEMDGYQATKCIRHSETLPNKIPIVALTANAVDGDEKKCIDSGMDAYLAKPIDIGKLKSVLAKYLSAGKMTSTQYIHQHSTQNTETYAQIDLTKIKQFDDLQVDGMPDVLSETIESFLKTTPTRILAIFQAISDNDLISCGREAHTIKSSAMALGALKFGERCKELELKSKNSLKREDVIEMAQQLKNDYQAVEIELQNLVKKRNSKPTNDAA